MKSSIDNAESDTKAGQADAGTGLNAMEEIKDLKNEIARLTESLSGFAAFTQSMSGNNNNNTNTMQSQRSLESKNTYTEVIRGTLGGLGHLDSRESTT